MAKSVQMARCMFRCYRAHPPFVDGTGWHWPVTKPLLRYSERYLRRYAQRRNHAHD